MRLGAKVRRRRDSDGDGLNEFLRDRLASYKHPGVVVAVGSIPRNAMGKVNKRALAGLFETDDVKASQEAKDKVAVPL